MADEVLTPAQKAAVETNGSAILVSAAAGSGKTKVLIERLMRCVCDPVKPCDVDAFLMITFTNKAAAELRSRILRELSERLALAPTNRHLQRQMSRVYLAQISTIHAFCAQLLRQYAYVLDIPADFRVLENAECARLRERVMQQVLEQAYARIDEDDELRALLDTLGAGRDDRTVGGIVQRVYNAVQCHIYPDKWIAGCIAALDVTQYHDLSETPWGAYLLDSFKTFLQQQLDDMRQAYALSCDADALQKKCAPVLEQNLAVLQALADAKSWEELCTQGSIDFGRMTFPKNYPQPEVAERIKYLRTRCRDSVRDRLADFGVPSQQAMQELRETAAALRGLFALEQAFSDAYRKQKLHLHALDFGDLEHDAVRLLIQKDSSAPTQAAREISERFEQIMVDEYQDTNEVQDCIFRAISRDGANRFMVGDVKQSIYRFRLAEPGIFLDKYKRYHDYRTAKAGEKCRILLSENFRSGEEILDAANAVFGACMSERVGGLAYGEEEWLRQGTPHQPLPYTPVELHCISTQTDEETPDKVAAEAAFVAARIRHLLDEKTPVREKNDLRPVTEGDIVILLRSAKSCAPYYMAALRAQSIACSCDADESVLDTQELESLVSLLQVLDNAHQDIPLAAAMLSPLFGFTAQELAQVRVDCPQGDLLDALRKARSNEKAAAFLHTLQQLRDAAQQLPLHALLAKIDELTAMQAVYGAMPNGNARVANLQWFFAYAAAFSDGGKKSLHQLLDRLDSEREQKLSAAPHTGANAVTIMSIHKSKGLEFPVVVLSDLSRKFNTEDLKALVLLHPTLGVGCSVYDKAARIRYPSVAKKAIAQKLQEENVSEELRVLYVAMTRAKDMLIMTYCTERLQKQLQELSRALTLPPRPALAAGADCLGKWVLLTALLRTEAGELFAYGGRPEQTQVSRFPWKICLHHAAQPQIADAPQPEQRSAQQQAESARDWPSSLHFCYASLSATAVPSKITATQLKGRDLDAESADGSTQQLPAVHLAKPVFSAQPHAFSATERGTATHLAMQYLDFGKTATLQQIQEELARMVEQRFLTQQQAQVVDPQKLLRVFQGALGEQIRAAKRVVREFKFSILTDAGAYYPDAAGEEIMLQGVTDCCLINPTGLTVIDFKTDRVAPGNEAAAAAHYSGQLEAYSKALSQIFGYPVEKRILYFFHTDTAAEI